MIELVYSKKFLKSVKKQLPQREREKLADLLILLQDDPFHNHLHTKPLSGELSGLFSFRITRTYRVIFRFIDPATIQLLRVGIGKIFIAKCLIPSPSHPAKYLVFCVAAFALLVANLPKTHAQWTVGASYQLRAGAPSHGVKIQLKFYFPTAERHGADRSLSSIGPNGAGVQAQINYLSGRGRTNEEAAVLTIIHTAQQLGSTDFDVD